jgi:hypothetical protein
MEISLIHPSRGRASQSFQTIKKWILKAGTNDMEIIVSLDVDDSQIELYKNLYVGLPLCIHDNKSSVEAINRAAKIAQGHILIVVSDDQEPSPQWAVRILRYTEGRKDWVLKSQDGIQPEMITQPIMDRVYYQRFGYIYYPGYQHLWADREFTDVATKLKRVIKKNIRFPHRHYSVMKRQPDEIYKRSNLTYEQGKKLYLERKKINFGL